MDTVLYCITSSLPHAKRQTSTCIAVKRKGKCNYTNEVEDVYTLDGAHAFSAL